MGIFGGCAKNPYGESARGAVQKNTPLASYLKKELGMDVIVSPPPPQGNHDQFRKDASRCTGENGNRSPGAHQGNQHPYECLERAGDAWNSSCRHLERARDLLVQGRHHLVRETRTFEKIGRDRAVEEEQARAQAHTETHAESIFTKYNIREQAQRTPDPRDYQQERER